MSSSLRIAILGTRGIPAGYGGFETFAEEISVRLAANGADVTVFCEKKPTRGEEVYKGVRLLHMPSFRLGPLTTIIFDLMCLWRARKGYDVVYMLGYGSSLFCFIPRLRGAKVLINMDGIEWARSKWSSVAKAYLKLMERVAMYTANHIVADAENIRKHLSDRFPRMPECSYIPYGSEVVTSAPNASVLSELGLKPYEYYLVVCRLEPENHVREILEGFRASKSRRHIVVFGDLAIDTPYVKKLQEVKDPRICFAGTLYDNEKLKSIRYHSYAYIHGHSVGGTNPSLLESLGCGNAVVAHDNPFNREVAGKAARYFSDSEGVAKLINDFDEDPEGLDAMRKEAINIINTRYTWEQVTTEYDKLFRAVTCLT